MSNFGDQARLPTDRPPDGRNIEDFPKTKSILWDKTGVGKTTFLHLGYFRKPKVCIPEKVLKLVQHQCENYGQKSHTLIGTLVVEDDGEGVQFQVDRLDTRPLLSADVSAHLAPGDLLIPLEVTNNTAGKRRGSVEDFVTALRRLQERCCSKSSIDLSSFVLLRGWVSFYSNAHSSVAHMDFDMVTMGTVFKATPIAAVPIVLTALSKNLSGPMSLSHTQGMPKSGYLTMDHARKLLLVLESDPKAGTLPIVGIWVSGVDFVQHSFVWAACLRYIHNTHLQDRVCSPPEEFLLVLYSPLHSRPEFFQCCTTTGESKLLYGLWCGHEVGNHTKSLSSHSDDFTEVELGPEHNGEERALFDAAQSKHSTILSAGQFEKSWTDDINPRSIPTPHTESLPVIKPMVPDVSILWTDSPNNTAFSSSVPTEAQPAPIQRQTTNASNRPPRPVMQSYYPNDITRQSTHVSSKSGGDNPQFNSSASRERGQFLPAHSSFQSTPISINNNSGVRVLNNQSNSLNSHINSKNVIPVHQNLYRQLSPQCEMQHQAISHSNHPSLSLPHNSYHPGIQSEPRKFLTNVQTFQHAHNVAFDNRPQNYMVLSSQTNNTCLTPSNLLDTRNQQCLVVNQNQGRTVPNSTQAPSGHQVMFVGGTPQWQNDPSVANEHRSQMLPQGISHLSWPSNSPHAPVSRSSFAPVNTLKTVVEENSSPSSSTSDGCHCHHGKNTSASNEDSKAKPSMTNASINGSTNNSSSNTTKSSDDDSGLSVTPERPSTSPIPKADGLLTSVGNTSYEKNTSALGASMDNVNWEQVPPEIRALLIQQNEQLKLLQQQIQLLMSNYPQKSVSADVSSTSSNTNTKESCSVAVNTSFSGDHQFTLQSHQDICYSQRPQTPTTAFSSNGIPQTNNQKEGQEVDENSRNEISPHVPMPTHNVFDSDEIKSPSLENSGSSGRSLHPETQTDFDCEVAKDSTIPAAEMSEFDPNRSQFDPSYPNDSDFFNNCQDESYSTVAEEATDPRQFYDQIMNNIHMFLTNGEENSEAPTDTMDQTSLSLHDSDAKYPDSANSTLFPHINYMSMMLGAGCDTGQSMEINAMAMKYLKDDQLTQMAMMLKQGGESEVPSTTKLLHKMITAGGSSKRSSSEISHLGISPNNLTMGTRNYLEKHGLLGNDSQYFNDYSVFDHSLKLNTDFSVAVTDRDSDMSSGNVNSLETSPMKNCRRKNIASSPPLLSEASTNPKDNRWQKNNPIGKMFPKDLGASPVLMPPKHYNLAQTQRQHMTDRKSHKGQGRIVDDGTRVDNVDSENILDIAKLKQLPKLL